MAGDGDLFPSESMFLMSTFYEREREGAAILEIVFVLIIENNVDFHFMFFPHMVTCTDSSGLVLERKQGCELCRVYIGTSV